MDRSLKLVSLGYCVYRGAVRGAFDVLRANLPAVKEIQCFVAEAVALAAAEQKLTENVLKAERDAFLGMLKEGE
jgi:hypothetical protein